MAKTISTRQLTGISIFTALVVILQLLGSFIRFGPFSISLVSIPIVIGAAVYGVSAGGWLGFVFGVTVLLSGDAAVFLAVNVPGTIFIVLVKGICCGLASGYVYRFFNKNSDTFFMKTGKFFVLLQKILFSGFSLWYGIMLRKDRNSTIAVTASAIICPVVNTGLFVLLCPVFLFSTISSWAGGEHIFRYMIFGMVGINFLVELGINMIFCPVILRLIHIGEKELSK